MEICLLLSLAILPKGSAALPDREAESRFTRSTETFPPGKAAIATVFATASAT